MRQGRASLPWPTYQVEACCVGQRLSDGEHGQVHVALPDVDQVLPQPPPCLLRGQAVEEHLPSHPPCRHPHRMLTSLLTFYVRSMG